MRKTVFLPGTMCTEKLISSLSPSITQNWHFFPLSNIDSFDRIAFDLAELSELNGKLDLIGFSLGAYSALYFAMLYPQKVNSLCLIANSGKALPIREVRLRKSTLEFMASHTYKGISTVRAKQMIAPGHQHEQEIIGLIKSMDRELGKQTLIKQLTCSTFRPNILHLLQHIDAKTLLIGGKEDQLVSFHELTDLHAVLSNCDLKLIENCGHMVLLEKPDEFEQCYVNWKQFH